MNLGIVENRMGDTESAREQYQLAQDARLQLLSASAGDFKLRKDIGIGYYNFGKLAFGCSIKGNYN